MPADGSIIIDTRINNKGAEADLKALQAKAKSTARQISALDKEIGQATTKRSKLAEDLEKAKAAADATAKALDEVNAKLDAAWAANLAAVRKEFPGMSAANAADIAQSRTQAQYAADYAQSDKLAAEYDKLQESVAALTGEYTRQQQAVQNLEQRKKSLVGQLEKEQSAANRAADAYQKQRKEQDRTSSSSSASRQTVTDNTARSKTGSETTRRIETAATAMQRFGSRLMGIVSGALVFNVISAGLSRMTSWMGAALQSTDAFGTALRNLQGAASVAAAPLIDVLGNALAYVINLLATGMSYLARFISLLTGKSLSAMKSGARAMNGYGAAAGSAAKQTEQATRSLAGFDEITRLDAPQDSSGGGGGGGVSGPNYDFVDQTGAGFSNLLNTVKKFWNRFSAALAPGISAWSAAWDQIRSTALSVWPQIQAAASGLWQNALAPLLGYLTGSWAPGIVNAFSQAFAPIAGDTLSAFVQMAADLFVWLCGIVTDATNNLIRPALDTLLLIWQGMMAGIQAAWVEYGQPLTEGAVEAFQNIESIFSSLYYSVVEPVLSDLIALLQRLWTDHLKKLWDDSVAMFAAMGSAILSFWNRILSPLINWLIASFGPVFAQVFQSVVSVVGTAVGLVSDAMDQAVLALKGILDFLTTVFQSGWKGVWNAIADTAESIWARITGAVRSAVNGVIGFVNGMISAVVNGLNRVIDAVNTLSFDVPSWVPKIGGSTFGFNIAHVTAPQIPYLAQGAVIPPNREFLAVLGDQSSGTNVEAPLSTIQQAVAAVMQDYQDGNLAGLEQISGLLRRILEAVYGIHIGDDTIGRAAERYRTRKAVITGGV